MTAIETFLHQHFASLGGTDSAPAASTSAEPPLPQFSEPEVLQAPFAKVDTVAANSPAQSAGLKPGDEIRNFGYVNRSNHENLKKVLECVQGNEDVSSNKGTSEHFSFLSASLTRAQNNIVIRVSRPTSASDRRELRLTLTPKRDWGGRGMLGCHILPL